MVKCEPLMIKGMILRLVLTFTSLVLIYKNMKNPVLNKWLFPLLFVMLSVYDIIDNYILFFYGIRKTCIKLYFYQMLDKFVDLISYFLLPFFFKLDKIFLFFIFYRMIGVGLFYWTKDSRWLILFFDMAKEYLLYKFVFPTSLLLLPIVVLLKIVYEFFHHTFTNGHNYTIETKDASQFVIDNQYKTEPDKITVILKYFKNTFLTLKNLCPHF